MSTQLEFTEEEAFFVKARREMRASAEVERADRERTGSWEAQVRARRRDGDQCRVCGQLVDFRRRRGPQAGTFVYSGEVVVACLKCSRQHAPRTKADLDRPVQGLRPVPARPFYRPETLEWFQNQVRAATSNLRRGFPDELLRDRHLDGAGQRLNLADKPAVVERRQLLVIEEARGVGCRDLPIGLRGYFHGLRLAAVVVDKSHRLGAALEARLNRALQKTSDEQVLDGDHTGGAGRKNLRGHGGISSARGPESTEGGAA